MSEISAAQKLASIVEESEHGSSLSTSGTFTDSSSRPPLPGRTSTAVEDEIDWRENYATTTDGLLFKSFH